MTKDKTKTKKVNALSDENNTSQKRAVSARRGQNNKVKTV